MILVTGARALARTEPAAAWARAQLARALAPHDELVTGDALGPDRWAVEIARARGMRVVVFNLFGGIGGTSERWTDAPRPPRYSPEGLRWPLLRNAAMVAWAAPRGAAVLALTAPWSTTRGTRHTADAAERAGLVVERVECPAEMGPC